MILNYHFLQHAAIACERKLELIWVEAGQLEMQDENGEVKVDTEEYKLAWEKIKSADGVVVPGGFGNRYVACLCRMVEILL